MRFVDLPSFGGIEQFRISEGPSPQPGPDEVLIRVAAAGLNRADLLQRQGHYPPPAGASPVLGMEVSGHIAALGPDADPRWHVDDPVCALVAGGGYAEYCAVPAAQCLPVPPAVALARAAALPEATFTVWANLFEPPVLHTGERLLVHGGSSGIGTLAIQIASMLRAHVAVTAGSEAKCSACLALGAERAINYREEDWPQAVREWSGGSGVDVILDMVGGDYFARNLDLLAPRGRMVSIAYQGGSQVPLDLRTLMSRRLTLTGSTLRSRSVEEKRVLRDSIEEYAWPLVAQGRVRPVVDRIFPLDQVAEAHRYMETGGHIGKILLQMV